MSNRMMKKYLFIGIGGMTGTLLRYLVTLSTFGHFLFPWDTLFVNIVGSFILTIVLLHSFIKKVLSPVFHKSLAVGVLGSFTTFSAVTVEVVELIQHNVLLATSYILLSILGGLLSCYFAYQWMDRRQVIQ